MNPKNLTKSEIKAMKGLPDATLKKLGVYEIVRGKSLNRNSDVYKYAEEFSKIMKRVDKVKQSKRETDVEKLKQTRKDYTDMIQEINKRVKKLVTTTNKEQNKRVRAKIGRKGQKDKIFNPITGKEQIVGGAANVKALRKGDVEYVRFKSFADLDGSNERRRLLRWFKEDRKPLPKNTTIKNLQRTQIQLLAQEYGMQQYSVTGEVTLKTKGGIMKIPLKFKSKGKKMQNVISLPKNLDDNAVRNLIIAELMNENEINELSNFQIIAVDTHILNFKGQELKKR